MQLLYLTLAHLQVFVGCDPVPPHPQHADDVMFVWEELRLLRLLFFLQKHCTRTVAHKHTAKCSAVMTLDFRLHSWNLKESVLICSAWGHADGYTCSPVLTEWVRQENQTQNSVFTSRVYDYIHSQASCLLQNHWQQVWWAVVHWNNLGCTHKGTVTWYNELIWFIKHFKKSTDWIPVTMLVFETTICTNYLIGSSFKLQFWYYPHGGSRFFPFKTIT